MGNATSTVPTTLPPRVWPRHLGTCTSVAFAAPRLRGSQEPARSVNRACPCLLKYISVSIALLIQTLSACGGWSTVALRACRFLGIFLAYMCYKYQYIIKQQVCGDHLYCCRARINRVRLPIILLVVSSTGKLDISLSPYAPENLVSRDGFSRPVPRQPAHSPYSG